MVRLTLRNAQPFWSFPSVWDEEDFSINSTSHGLEVFETDDKVVVKASVPGIKNEDLDVTFEDGVLRVSGKTQENEEETKRKKVVYQSQRVTSFNYATTLPRAIDAGKLEAEIENGVVTVSAPLASEAKPKKVTVTLKK